VLLAFMAPRQGKTTTYVVPPLDATCLLKISRLPDSLGALGEEQLMGVSTMPGIG
jgi:hypothetical protein